MSDQYKNEVLHNYKLKLRIVIGLEKKYLVYYSRWLNMNYRVKLCRNCETCLNEDYQYDAFVVIKD